MANKRKPIILIGAPSGAGKSSLSASIKQNKYPFIMDLCGCDSSIVMNHDAKTLPDELPDDKVHIIEFATQKLDIKNKKEWAKIQNQLHKCEKVVYINIDVPNYIAARQFFFRIFRKSPRHARIKKVLNISRYVTALRYLLTQRIYHSQREWTRLGHSLADSIPCPVIFIRAMRSEAAYEFVIESRVKT
jgi:adenylate kinase family enzyme